MCAYDCQLREVGGYVIKINRTRVVQPYSHPSGRAGSEAVSAGMKERRHTELGYLLVKRIELFVIRIKSLNPRMKLCSDQPKLGDRTLHFVDRALSLPRISAGKPDELTRKAFDHIRNLVVCERR